MAEREVDIQLIPESIPLQTPDLAQKLINTHYGRVHIGEAITFATFGDQSVHIGGLVEIAEIINSVRIPQEEASEVLQPILNIIKDSGQKKRITEWGTARVDVLMGNYESLESNISVFSPPYVGYLSAARTMAERGEDPNNMLQKAEVLVQRQNAEDPLAAADNQLKYCRVKGGIYAQAGLMDEARLAFDVAEGLLDRSRAKFNTALQESLDGGFDEELALQFAFDASDLGNLSGEYTTIALAYVEAGWYRDALRVVDKLKDDGYFTIGSLDDVVVENQLSRALADEAINTALKSGGVLYAKTLARKAIIDLTQGKPVQETVELVEKVAEVTLYSQVNDRRNIAEHIGPDDSIKILTSLAALHARGGDFEAAKKYFNKAWEIVGEYDDWRLTPYLIFDMAMVVDEAGLDASNIFAQSLDAVEAIQDEEDHWDYKWSTLASLGTILAEKGHLDLARDALARYEKRGSSYDADRFRFLAFLAGMELKNGTSVKTIPVAEIQAVLAGDNENASQAIQYLQEKGALNIG